MKIYSKLLLGSAWLLGASSLAAQSSADWTTYGHDKGGQRFSPLTQITPENVDELKPAWSYVLRVQTPEQAATPRRGPRSGSQITPLVLNGIMYVSTLDDRVVALDASDGRELWVYNGPGPARGLEYWPGNGQEPAAILFSSAAGLVSLNARTGEPNTRFGGTGMLTPRMPGGSGGSTAAPVLVAGNIVISNSNPYADGGRPEDIRAFDVVTGEQLWRFDTIPKAGQTGADTWPADYADHAVLNGAVGMWGQPTVDVERGIVYVLLDSPQWERWGGDRAGDNLFGNSLVALDLRSGRYLWHFQAVHHDLWDLDLTGQPLLFNVERGGQSIPAVAIVGKPGLMFMFNRVTGEPLHEIVETPVAPPNVPGEVASPTQPMPVRPANIARTSFSIEELAEVTAEHTAACMQMITEQNLTFGGPYNPPGYDNPAVQFPGANGAGNYGGMTMNPELGYIYVNTQDLGQITRVGPRGVPRVANGTVGVPAPSTARHIPYDMVGFNGRFAIMEPVLMPCQAPPWGRLSAVDVRTGEIAWQVPLGVTESLPEGQQLTGRPNLGGPTATASGLVFIGASDDSHFRAFDARTGATLWDVKLEAPVNATPITYADETGKQFVAAGVGSTLHVFTLGGE